MITYHKIKTVFSRDPKTRFKTIIDGEFAMPEFKFLQNNRWIYTEKVDGANVRVMYDGRAITFGGKTDQAQLQTGLFNRLNDRFLPQVNQFGKIFTGTLDDIKVCLYGEGYGPKIQKGGKYRADQDFVLFDVNINGWWLQRKDVEDIAEVLGLDIVPIIGEGTLYNMVDMTRARFNSMWGDFMAEGIVARPATELKTRSGQRIITKIKRKDFPKP